MATRQSISRLGVKREDFGWGMIYLGTREALLTERVVEREELFADGSEKDRYGRTVRTKHGVVDGRNISVAWFHARGVYEARIYRTHDEQRAFEDAEAKECAERNSAITQDRLRREAQTIGPLPIAKACLDGAGLSLIMAFNMTDSPDRPYRFSAEAKAKVTEHFQKIMWWFENGGFEPRLGAVAAGDSEFQRFMQRALPGASGSDAR